MALAGPRRSWSDLPTELAGLILCRLPAYSDRVRFGAVCHHWCFSGMLHRLPPPMPCLALPDGSFFSLPHDRSFHFPGIMGHHSSCGEWLVFLCDGTCYLKNPFSKITLTLPNLSCFSRIDEPGEIINDRFPVVEEVLEEVLEIDANVLESEMSIDKVIMCSTTLVAAIVYRGDTETVALCRPGAKSWLVSEVGRLCGLTDMMFYDGKLFFIDEFKDLFAIHVGEDNESGKLSISRIERLIESPFATMQEGIFGVDEYLVESHGAVLMVRETIFRVASDYNREGRVSSDYNRECKPQKTVRKEYNVFKADFHSSQWVAVTSVGDDQALFVGRSYSQSLCVSQYKLKGNRIYIRDGKTCTYSIYDMSDGKIYLPKPSGLFESDGKICLPKPSGLFERGKTPVTWLFPQ